MPRPGVPAPSTARIAWLDSARAAMLLLGVPFHASEIYRLHGERLLESPVGSFAATAFGALVHVFRMPAFFVLAGFFASLLLSRRGDAAWLRERCVRLGVPLVFSLLAFGWLEQALAHAGTHDTSLVDAVAAVWRTSPVEWSHHRWFLWVLLLYCACAVAARRALPEGALERTARWLGASPYRPGRAAAALVCAGLVVVASGALPWADGMIGTDGEAHDDFFMRHAAFFLVGYCAHRLDGNLDRLLVGDRADRSIAIASLVAWCVLYPGFHAADTWLGGSGTAHALRAGVGTLAGFHGARLFLRLARRCLDVRTRAIAWLVEGALCIYLVHELFVLWLGDLLIGVAWPAALELVLVSAGALVLSVLAWAGAGRSRTLSLLLNGRTGH